MRLGAFHTGQGTPVRVGPGVFFEHGQRAAHQAHHTVGMTAGAPAVHNTEAPAAAGPTDRSRPRRGRVGSCRRRWQAGRTHRDHTGPSSGLPCSAPPVPSRSGRRPQDRARSRCRRRRTRPSARSGREAYGVAKWSGSDPAAAVATYEECAGGTQRVRPSRDVEKSRAPDDLDHSGVLHGARNGDERGAGVVDRSMAAKGVGPRNVRSCTHGPGSLRCGSAPVGARRVRASPCRVGTTGGTGRRRPTAPTPTPRRRRNGQADAPVARPPGGQPAAARSARACAVAAATASRPAGTHTVTCAAPRGGRQELSAVEHQVGGADQQKLVLVAGRLALHGIHEDGAARSCGAGHCQLDGGREPGSAAAGQSGRLERADKGLPPLPSGRGGHRKWAKGGDMAGEICRMAEDRYRPGAATVWLTLTTAHSRTAAAAKREVFGRHAVDR